MTTALLLAALAMGQAEGGEYDPWTAGQPEADSPRLLVLSCGWSAWGAREWEVLPLDGPSRKPYTAYGLHRFPCDGLIRAGSVIAQETRRASNGWTEVVRVDVVSDPQLDADFMASVGAWVADATRPEERRFHPVVERLGSARYHYRERAAGQLLGMGDSAVPLLAFGTRHPDAEVRSRCESLLNQHRANAVRYAVSVSSGSW